MSTETWVNFKTFGLTFAIFGFILMNRSSFSQTEAPPMIKTSTSVIICIFDRAPVSR